MHNDYSATAYWCRNPGPNRNTAGRCCGCAGEAAEWRLRLTDTYDLIAEREMTGRCFWAKFNVVARSQKWDSDEKKMEQFPLFLDGDAFLIFDRMDAADQKKPDEVVKRMREAFGLTKSQAYKSFVSRKLRAGESPDGYVADLQRLAKLSGHASGGDTDSMVIEQMIVGLPSVMAQQVRLALAGKEKKVSGILELIRALQQVNSTDDVDLGAATASFNSCKIGPAAGTSGETSKRSVMCFRCNQIGHVRKNCPMKSSGSGDASRGDVSSGSSRPGQGASTCYFCDKPGHRKAECEERKAWLAQRSGKSAGCSTSTSESASGASDKCLCAGSNVPVRAKLVRIFADVRADTAGQTKRGRAVVDTGSTRTLVSQPFAESNRFVYEDSELDERLLALDGSKVHVLGRLQLELQRTGGPVSLPPTTVNALVVRDLDTVDADVLIGGDVIAQCGGLRLSYGEEGGVTGVQFGSDLVMSASCQIPSAPAQDSSKVEAALAHPSRHVQVARSSDSGNITLRSSNGEVTWLAAEKHWQMSWCWLSDQPPVTPIGSGVGEYSRDKLTEHQEQLFRDEVQLWIAKGFLIKHDRQEHGEPVCVLPLIAVTQEHKVTTPVRPCLDYRYLNKKICSRPGFDPPVCGDTLRRWRTAGKKLALLDIRKAYLQIHVSPELYRYQVVLWEGQTYVMTRMGFGLSVAPKIMDVVVKYVTQVFDNVDNYYDDLLVPTESVDAVAARLLEYSLPTKAAEPLSKARVLGLQLAEAPNGQLTWSRRQAAGIAIKHPITKRRIFKWCGRLTSHYPVCSWLRPACSYLKRLASAERAGWDDPVAPGIVSCCREVEEKLAIEDPVKGLWSVSADEWVVWSDASGIALGAVLEANGTIVEDVSELRPDQDKRHINIIELEATIMGLDLAAKWGAKRITLKTDSRTVAGWLEQVVNDVRRVKTTGLHDLLVQRRLQIIDDIVATAGLSVQIVWVPSELNLADALTRVPQTWLPRARRQSTITDVAASSALRPAVVGPLDLNEVAIAQRGDATIQRIKTQLAEDEQVSERGFKSIQSQLLIKDEVLYRNLKLPISGEVMVPVVPVCLEEAILQAAHKNTGHAAWQTMYEVVREHCYFPNIAEKCQAHVAGCHRCKAASSTKGRSAPSTRPDMPSRPWEVIQIDTLELGLNRSGRYHCVLVCIDMYTKWVEVLPLRRHDGASVAAAIVELCCRWGSPRVVRMDNGTEFSNAVVQSVFKVFGVQVKTGAVRHPQSQGGAERFNRTLLTLVRKILDESSDWLEELQMLTYYYRTRPHGATGISPMLAMVGWEPPSLVAREDEWNPEAWSNQHAARSARVRDLLDQQTARHDKMVEETECCYQVGGSVLLRQPNRHQKRLPPFQQGWKVKKIVAPSTVVISRNLNPDKVQEKVVNVDLIKLNVEEDEVPPCCDDDHYDIEDSDDDDVYQVRFSAGLDPLMPTSGQEDDLNLPRLRDRASLRPPARYAD